MDFVHIKYIPAMLSLLPKFKHERRLTYKIIFRVLTLGSIIKGSIAVGSIDFLSFLLSLSYLPDAQRENEYGSENIQVIQLNEKYLIIDKPIEVFQVQELLTYFWFEKMKMAYNAEIHIATEPNQKVQINGEENRTIGNLKITLIEKGGLKHG